MTVIGQVPGSSAYNFWIYPIITYSGNGNLGRTVGISGNGKRFIVGARADYAEIWGPTPEWPGGMTTTGCNAWEPTPAPTFAPVPNVEPVALDHVCGPEVFLTRRLDEEADGHRALTAWTPDSCYYSCKAALNNPPTFVSAASSPALSWSASARG